MTSQPPDPDDAAPLYGRCTRCGVVAYADSLREGLCQRCGARGHGKGDADLPPPGKRRGHGRRRGR